MNNTQFVRKPSKIHGTGTFASRGIRANTPLGRVLTKKNSTGDAQKDYDQTGFGDFLNHSPEPNIDLKKIGPSLYAKSLRDIDPGEELVANYRHELSPVKDNPTDDWDTQALKSKEAAAWTSIAGDHVKQADIQDVANFLHMGGTAALLGSLFAKNPKMIRKLQIAGLGSHLGGMGLHIKTRSDLKKALRKKHLEKQAMLSLAKLKKGGQLFKKLVIDPFIEAPRTLMAATKMPGKKGALKAAEEIANKSIRRRLPAPGAPRQSFSNALKIERDSVLRKEYRIPGSVSGEALEGMAMRRAARRKRLRYGEGALDFAVLGSGKVIDTAVAPYLIASGYPALGAAAFASPMAHIYKFSKDFIKGRMAKKIAKP